MTSYNSSKYIKEQLDSIFLQLSKNDELIICDDCSVDNTVSIIESYKDSRIKLFKNKKNLGANGNFEKCLSKVTGDIIVISDSDNVWLDNKISKVLPYFDDKKVNMVMHDAIITDKDLCPILDSYYMWRHSKPGLIRNIIKSGYGGSMMTFRASLLTRLLPFPKHMPFFFDEWIGMIAEKYGKCVFISDKLSYWRRHEEVTSSIGAVGSNRSQCPESNEKMFKKFVARINERIRKIILVIVR